MLNLANDLIRYIGHVKLGGHLAAAEARLDGGVDGMAKANGRDLGLRQTVGYVNISE